MRTVGVARDRAVDDVDADGRRARARAARRPAPRGGTRGRGRRSSRTSSATCTSPPPQPRSGSTWRMRTALPAHVAQAHQHGRRRPHRRRHLVVAERVLREAADEEARRARGSRRARRRAGSDRGSAGPASMPKRSIVAKRSVNAARPTRPASAAIWQEVVVRVRARSASGGGRSTGAPRADSGRTPGRRTDGPGRCRDSRGRCRADPRSSRRS
jgi:hypothetical protein